MHDRESLEARLDSLGANDPRVGSEYVRIVESGRRSPVVLLGVVHDHPASVHRVRTVVESLDPAVLGLELPPLVTPLFEQFAGHAGTDTENSTKVSQSRREDRSTLDGALADGGTADAEETNRRTTERDTADERAAFPEMHDETAGKSSTSPAAVGPGGEMSAAIEAAGDARVVGLDMPDGRSLTALATTLWRERVSAETARTVAYDVWTLCRHAVEGRLVAAGAPANLAKHDLMRQHRYEVTTDDPPVVQADHEHSHVRRSRALHQSLEPPRATRLVDDVRERRIGTRLAELSAETTEPVVAVVGYDHLDRIAEAMVEGPRE
jgi:pheromone shutdown protein TraB